jgi:hypothetical protein
MLQTSCALFAAAVTIAMQPPQGKAENPAQVERPAGSRSDSAPELASQIQKLLEYLEQRASRSDQPPRVAEIGAQSSTRPDRMVSRIYDIGDLFIPAPAYTARFAGDWDSQERNVHDHIFPELIASSWPGPFGDQVASADWARSAALMQQGGLGGGLGGGGMGGMAGNSKSSIRPDLDSLIEAITSTITPNSWSAVGGSSTINTLGSVLLVSANEETHRQVDQFLRLLRQLWGTSRTIRLHAHWLWLRDAELAQLFPDGNELSGAVDRQAWKAMRDRLNAGDERGVGYRAHITCFDGQTVFVSAGDRRLSLAGLKPTVASQAVAYTPEVRVLHEGAVLQVTPTATSEAKAVILDVHSRVTQLRDDAGPEDRKLDPKDNELARLVAELHGKRIEEHHLASTLLVPLQTIVLVGGMSGASQDGERQLYLFVELGIQEARTPNPALPATNREEPAEPKQP